MSGYSFTDATTAWFEASFPGPTDAQRLGWDSISSGSNTLIHAPTGSGKTLAAFLWTIDKLLHEEIPPAGERCRVLYISPMKALAYDIERNLRAPLGGIRHAAERIGGPRLPDLTTFLRTGDTSAAARRRMQRNPPDILITTPESLYLLLTSQARETLRSVRYVICDEVHAVAGTKRGTHLALSLERLEEITTTPPQRIGLSATQRPLETIATFLGGGTIENDGKWKSRPVAIVDAPSDRELDLELVVPVENMAEPDDVDPLDPDRVRTKSIWPAVYPRILELIEQHQSTIVFANSRRLAERVCNEINNLAGYEVARAHHGSVARDQRIQIEESLKRGDLKAVVATSSLELGIDMGAVDLVVQIEAPISVASGLQRVGRAGHQVGAVSVAKIFPKYRGDLVLATVLADRMITGKVESTKVPRNPLDVLSQQLVAAVVIEDRDVDDLFEMVRRATPYRELTRPVFEATLDMLAGRYPSDLFSELRPRVIWDRIDGSVTARGGSRQLAVSNAGTIPDRGLYRVMLPEGGKVGELDEEMVYESRVGDVFILGSSTWRIIDIGPDRVDVVPAPGAPAARMPYWHGDTLGRSLETGRAVGAFVREIDSLTPADAHDRLTTTYRLDDLAAKNLVDYIAEERSESGTIPTDQTLVVQRFKDEIGDWRVVLLSPLGARVHAPWAMAVTQKLRDRYGTDVDVIWSDDGIAFRFPDTDDIPPTDELFLDPEELEPLLTDHLVDTAMFAARFREAAGRALLLPRRRPGQRTPLWLQRRRAAELLSVAKQFGSFPIILETFREILQDDFDVASLQEVLGDIRARKIRIAEIESSSPSPFASSLLFAFVAAYLYEGDAPLAERRAAALTLDRELLRELLGEGELRDLLDQDQMTSLELELQRLSEDRQVRGADGIHDLLRVLGPLSSNDIELRIRDTDVFSALQQLSGDRRAIEVHMLGEVRWAASEDAGRLRDAQGVQPPTGVAHAFLEPVDDPLGDVVARFARTHGPFPAEAAAHALGLPVGVVTTALRRLDDQRRVVEGAFRPGGAGLEWIDSDVLRQLKRRSLSALRSEIEPVKPDSLGRFLPVWQGVGASRPRGRGPLLETVRRLQGADMPASALLNDILPARNDDAESTLDQLMIEGEVVWTGRGTLGPRDGKLALYFRDQLPLLWLPPTIDRPDGELHGRIREHLGLRGASFFKAIYLACGGGDPTAILDAVWDLVWAGEVTNDTLAPVRAFGRVRKAKKQSRPTLASTFPAHAAGRWSLVQDLVDDVIEPITPTQQATAWCHQLLDRHGVVTRQSVASEGLPGGFTSVYPVLQHLEETGRVRRGYFIEGLGGAQFALPGAVDRVRTTSDTGAVLLASTDPANPYGAANDWPPISEGRVGRIAKTHVILYEGHLRAFIDGRKLRTFDVEPDMVGPIAAELAALASRSRTFKIESIDGEPPSRTIWSGFLTEMGFSPALRGLAYRN